MAEYHSISDLVKLSINNKQELWQVVLTGQAHDKLMSERDVFAQMKKMYQAMKSADEQYDQQLRSPSKMAGGDGYKITTYISARLIIKGFPPKMLNFFVDAVQIIQHINL